MYVNLNFSIVNQGYFSEDFTHTHTHVAVMVEKDFINRQSLQGFKNINKP